MAMTVEFMAALREALTPLGMDVPDMEAPREPARLKDIVADIKAHPPKAIALGSNTQLDTARKQLIHRGQIVELTEKEALLLACLAEHKDGLTREALLDKVWGYHESVDTHTLETHIHRLRAKLKTLPEAPECIMTTADGYALHIR
jgi:DNA-binding response OmpR family regulator